MFALVWGAVRTRTAQVLTVGLLTALAAAVAAAGPWYGYASASRAAAVDVATAPSEQRTLSVRKIADTDGDPRGTLDQFGDTVRGLLPLPAADPVNGLQLQMTVNRGGNTPAMPVAYRDGFCDHVKLDGACPANRFEAAIGVNDGLLLGLGIGDTLQMRATPTTEPIQVKIVGRYTRVDPTGSYWGNPLFEVDTGLNPVFTTLDTFTARQLWEPTLSFDVLVPDALIRGDDGYDLDTVLRSADARMGAVNLRLVDSTGPILRTITRDRAEIRLGVLVATLQILVLTWFAIGLAGRYTGRDRRGDAALLKLRGSSRLGTLRLAWGQHLVPLVAGVVIGTPVGWLLARWLAGPVATAGDRRSALLLSLAAVAAVLLGGLLVLALLEWLVLRRPVADLLRQVGSGRGDWRAGLVDLLLLAVAVAGVYQARAGDSADGLALAAPALVALAVALLLARLLGRLADTGGGAAMRTGHLRLGLTAVQVSRQPGTDRVFALVVVAVAMFTTAAGGWQAERTFRAERSDAELGAARVLTVETANRTVLLDAVRRADPTGEQAMAAVVDDASVPPVLAVDTARLAAVAHWRPEFGPIGALRPGGDAAELPRVTGTGLSVRLRSDASTPAALGLVLQNDATGSPVTVRFGPLSRGEQTRTATLAGCDVAPGCRIVRWEVTTPPTPDGATLPADPGTAITVRELTQRGPDTPVLGPAELGDITRWRPATSGAALDVAASGGVLRLAVDPNPAGDPDSEAYAVDTDLPLPVVLAGAPPETWRFAEPSMFALGGTPVPLRVAGTATALPVLGQAGVLVDIEAARRITADANPPGRFEVWLAPGAGPAVVDALRAAGLSVSADDTTAERSARLARQAPAAVARFALVCGAVGLLLAAAALAVAGAVDRRTRLQQLRALRVQGLADRAAVATAYAGTVALAGAGLIGGMVAALIAGPAARVTVPAFTDGWDVLPPPVPLGAPALLLAGLAALILLGLVAAVSVLPLIRGLREGRR